MSGISSTFRWKHVWHDNSASLTPWTPAPFTTSWLSNANQEDITNPYSSSRSCRAPCNYGEPSATEFQPAAAESFHAGWNSARFSSSLSTFFFFFSISSPIFSHATLFWIERLRLISWSQQCCHYWFWTSVFTACLAWLSTLSLPRMPECEQEAWMNGTLRTRFYYRSWMCCHYFCVISSWSYVQSARRSLSLHWFFLR